MNANPLRNHGLGAGNLRLGPGYKRSNDMVMNADPRHIDRGEGEGVRQIKMSSGSFSASSQIYNNYAMHWTIGVTNESESDEASNLYANGVTTWNNTTTSRQ